MILDMRHSNYDRHDAREATIIVNASLSEFTDHDLECSNAKILSFDSFRDERVCSATRIEEFLERRKFFCPNLELIDLSRACSPDADLESAEAKRFYQFVRTLKENTDIDIITTPELEKLFPILLPKDEEDDKLLEAYVIPLQEERLSSLQAITKLQLAQAEEKLSPELCHEILEHSNNTVVSRGVISAIDKQLSKGTEQVNQYIPTLLGCIAGRYVSSDNFDAIVDIAEKHISPDNITTEDINFCFGLQKESSQSEETSQRISNLIKGLIPHLPEEVRQDLDAKAALKEKRQQEYIQKRQKLQARVNEYSGYLILSDALDFNKNIPSEHIRKIGNTIYDNAEEYLGLYEIILNRINADQDEYKIKAAAHWVEPIILRINSLGQNKTDIELLGTLTNIVTKNQDVRHQFGHIFCQQLKKNNDSEFWMKQIDDLLDNNRKDHILLMNTYEDMEQAYKVRPELIPECLAIFKSTLSFEDIEKGFNDHLHTLASIVGDMAQEHPEFTDKAIEILSDLANIEKNSPDSSSKSYFRSKIDDAFDKIKQTEIAHQTRRDLTIAHEKDQEIFADVVKELMNDPQTDQQLIEKAIKMRLNSGLDVMIDDYSSAEGLKWNLAVLRSEALQNKGPNEIFACAERIFKNGVLTQLKNNPNYDPSETFQAFYDAAPSWLKKLREKISDTDDLSILQHFDRIPKEAQKLYIGEYTGKIDNLITTDNLKNFPEIAALKLKLEVCDYISDISSKSNYKKKRSLSGMEKWANLLKEINGYSSPEACVLALNEAIRIRGSISLPGRYYSCEYACKHFYGSKKDLKQFIKISTDIIDNVFEQIRQHNNAPILKNTLKNTSFPGIKNRETLHSVMGTAAAEAFLSGNENYKVLWDKEIVEKSMNAYLMLEKKPCEILQDLPFDKRIDYLDSMDINTYSTDMWEDFPELLDEHDLTDHINNCEDKADKDVVQLVKTCCKTRIDDTTAKCKPDLLEAMMKVYDAEAKKGIEDKELFSVLYKIRFSKENDDIQMRMKSIYNNYDLTAPKLKSLCQTSHLINKWILKKSTNEK